MIEIIEKQIDNKKLRSFLNNPFPEMVKFVVDIEKNIIALGGEMHADAERILLENNSEQKNLWGGNIYPDKNGEIEFTSLINIRPSQENLSMEIQSEEIKNEIIRIVKNLIEL